MSKHQLWYLGLRKSKSHIRRKGNRNQNSKHVMRTHMGMEMKNVS